MIVLVFGNSCSPLAVMWEAPLHHVTPMTAISSCKMVRPSASNNLQSKQTWRSLTFIETSDPVRWFQFSSLCSVFTDRQVLRFRFNNEEKFLLGLLLLVLAALGLATDGWLELITLNGENIIWPHRFSPRGCVPPHRHRHMECFTGWAEGGSHIEGALCLRPDMGFYFLTKFGTPDSFISISQWHSVEHRVISRTRKTYFSQWNCSQTQQSSLWWYTSFLFGKDDGGLCHKLDSDKPKGKLLSHTSL